MSSSFRLRYFLGLIPSAQKIDSVWTELQKLREELLQLEASKELARFNELNSIVQTTEFHNKKREIVNLAYKGSPEYDVITELKDLENSKPIKDYFRFTQSADFTRFNQIAKSTALARYLELKKTVVESMVFIQRKKDVESLRYKGSPEYIKIEEYNKLKGNRQLKRYYTTIASNEYRSFLESEPTLKGKPVDKASKKDPKFKAYLKFLNSKSYKNVKTVESMGLVGKLEQLKQQVEAAPFIKQVAYLKNKSRYETTPDFALLSEFKSLDKNPDILFYLKIQKSSINKNHEEVEGSKQLAHFHDLKIKVADTTFKERVAFLQNKKRFETTNDYKLETEYNELDKSNFMTHYRKLKKRPELSFFEQWEVVLDENFHNSNLSDSLWEPENYWHASRAGCSFSQVDEIHAYNGIKNIEIKNSVLSIVTKAEKANGRVWDPAVGVIPKQFDYSSSILNTGKGFKITEGVIEAKVKFSAVGAITSAFSLTGNHPFPQIDVFRSGHNCVGIGIIDQPDKNGIKKLVQIKGLNFSRFHVFRLEIFGNEVVWKINNYEVHRERLTKNVGELFLNFVGSLHHPVNGGTLPHYFEIDWVRCLRKKQAK